MKTLKFIALAAISIVGTAAWAAAFHRFSFAIANRSPFEIALAVGVAAAVGWVALGASILLHLRLAFIFQWFEKCLEIQSAGMFFLLLDALLNITVISTPRALFIAALICLMASDIVMTILFLRSTANRHVPMPSALGYWFGALHGAFVVTIIAFAGLFYI